MNKIPINIWDDFDESIGETYLYIDGDFDLKTQFTILKRLEGIFKENFPKIAGGLELYDSSVLYPNIPTDLAYKRWQISLKCLNVELIYGLVNMLNSNPQLIDFEFYSES